MSVTYHAQQFEKTTGTGPRSKVYEFKKRSRKPKQLRGYTVFVSNDRGHLLPHVRKSLVHPYTWFVGTWDLPTKIPGSIKSFTGRSEKSLAKFKEERKQWTDDLKRAWVYQPKYESLTDHFRGVSCAKNSPVYPEIETIYPSCPWEVAGIKREIFPTNIANRDLLDKFRKPIVHSTKKEILKNKNTCFHSMGYHHPKEFTCSKFKDDTNEQFPSRIPNLECERYS